MDHSKGEVKQIRGSGPPILSLEGNAISIGEILYVLTSDYFGNSLPQTAEVIGIDLTRRTIRLQVLGGREILYCATNDTEGMRGGYWLFNSAEMARANAINMTKKYVKRKEEDADRALDELEKAKEKLTQAESWEPKDWGNL